MAGENAELREVITQLEALIGRNSDREDLISDHSNLKGECRVNLDKTGLE